MKGEVDTYDSWWGYDGATGEWTLLAHPRDRKEPDKAHEKKEAWKNQPERLRSQRYQQTKGSRRKHRGRMGRLQSTMTRKSSM